MNFKEQLSTVKAFVFDCDGVFTNGEIISLTNGDALRKFNVKDGYGVALAIKRGYPICIISGGVGESMQKRFEHLGIKDIHLNCKDKVTTLKKFAEKQNLKLEEILFMGDDIPDVDSMMLVGVACAPYDAVPEARYVSQYISALKGGEGCVRDVIEQVLKAQNNWSTTSQDIFSR